VRGLSNEEMSWEAVARGAVRRCTLKDMKRLGRRDLKNQKRGLIRFGEHRWGVKNASAF